MIATALLIGERSYGAESVAPTLEAPIIKNCDGHAECPQRVGSSRLDAFEKGYRQRSHAMTGATADDTRALDPKVGLRLATWSVVRAGDPKVEPRLATQKRTLEGRVRAGDPKTELRLVVSRGHTAACNASVTLRLVWHDTLILACLILCCL